jgi:predicted transcriptional regulator
MRIKIEIEDESFKSVHEFESQNMEGEAIREKIIGFLTASGVFSNINTNRAAHNAQYGEDGETLMERLEKFILYEFPDAWFTSQELRDRYETLSDDIKISTVSTYLSRMNRDGLLERKGNRNNRQYRLIQLMPELPEDNSYQQKRRAEGRL